MKIAVYAGSFDPITNGHKWVIETAYKMFDLLYVAIGDNKSKKYMFSDAERFSLVSHAIDEIDSNLLSSHRPPAPYEGHDNLNIDRVRVTLLKNQYLADYAKELQASYLIRGVRNAQDFEFEKTLQNVNSEINPELTTIWLCPPKNLSEVSSSVVKSLVGPIGWRTVVGKMVPTHVLTELQNKLFLSGKWVQND